MYIDNFINKLETAKIDINEILLIIKNKKLKFFWHPLGFIMCKYLVENNVSIRIHIWPKDGGKPQKPYWNIHNHIFSLKSWVLYGEITNKEYELLNDDQSNNVIYKVNYSNNISSLIKTEKRVKIKQANIDHNNERSSYGMKSGIFHLSENTGKTNALTIMYAEDSNMQSPEVIGHISGLTKYEYKRSEVSSDYLDKLINEFFE